VVNGLTGDWWISRQRFFGVPFPVWYPLSADGARGFTGDPDVMDTWATSSLTPDIVGATQPDGSLFDRILPMNMRPQAHEIIRTWLFSSVVRSHFRHASVPWHHAAISGSVSRPQP
jgi:valyl-tRNA synthetase